MATEKASIPNELKSNPNELKSNVVQTSELEPSNDSPAPADSPAPTPWSPWRAWGMDLLKFFITFGIGAIVTITILNKIDERRIADRSRSQLVTQLRINAMDNFRKSSFRYGEAALDAYTDLYVWRGTKTAAMLRYEQGAYEDYQIAVEELKERFKYVKTLPAMMEDLTEIVAARHHVYDAIADQMHDTGTFGPSLPNQERMKFDEYHSKYQGLREKIVNDLESQMLNGAQ